MKRSWRSGAPLGQRHRTVRIEIDNSVLNDPNAHQWLDRILYRIEDGWHVWDTSQADLGICHNATWIRDRGPQGEWVREMLVASIKRAAWTLDPHVRSVRVTARPATADEFTPESAYRLAEEPLVILVENRISDGKFVKRIVMELDKSLGRLWSQPGRPIRVDSLGGEGQLAEEIDRRVRDVPYRPRLVVIVDSNRKAPGGKVSEVARKLRLVCGRLGVACWVLAKREAENYLPRVLLDERPNAGATHALLVGAWDRLRDDQKDYFDMKSGLPSTPCPIEQALFDGLSPTDRNILSNGFGPNVYKCWAIWTVQAKTELVRRGEADLKRGVDLIRKEV